MATTLLQPASDRCLASLVAACGAHLHAIDSTSTAGYDARIPLLPGLVMVTATTGACGLKLEGDDATGGSHADAGTFVTVLTSSATLVARGRVDAVVANLPVDAISLHLGVGWESDAAERQTVGRLDCALYALVKAALADAASPPSGRSVPRYVVRAIVQHYIDRHPQGHGRIPKNGAPLAAWQLRATESSVSAGIDGAIRIDSLADACGLTEAQFRRAFKHSTGTTPHRWLLQCRLERARDELLATDRSVTDIALLCGFADQSHLTRHFCAAYGAPPAQWRRKVRREEA
jgi:AraC-like DNA-binding protein